MSADTTPKQNSCKDGMTLVIETPPKYSKVRLLWLWVDDFELVSVVKMPVQNDVTGPNKSLASAVCTLCEEGFAAEERMVNSNGQILHERCFM